MESRASRSATGARKKPIAPSNLAMLTRATANRPRSGADIGPCPGKDCKPMIVLGIETTCDETAAAIVERDHAGRGRILSDIVLSQTDEHAAFGGVVPEIAARAHVEVLDLLIA